MFRGVFKEAVIFSPTAVPMLPIMKRGSMMNRQQGCPPMRAVPQRTASRSLLTLRTVSNFSW